GDAETYAVHRDDLAARAPETVAGLDLEYFTQGLDLDADLHRRSMVACKQAYEEVTSMAPAGLLGARSWVGACPARVYPDRSLERSCRTTVQLWRPMPDATWFDGRR